MLTRARTWCCGSNVRSKMTLFHIAIIICIQTLCFCAVESIDIYIGKLDLALNATINHSSSSDNETCFDEKSGEVSYSEDDDIVYRRNIANSFPAIVMTYGLGLIIPFLGKRFVLVLPMIGITIQMVMALAIIYLKWQIYWWYLSGFMLGLLGNPGIIDFVVALIVVDLTNASNRSLWFVAFYALRCSLEGLGTFLIFCFAQYHGYVGIFWFTLLLQVISIVFIFRYFDLTLYNHTNVDTDNEFSLTTDIFIIFRGTQRSTQQKIAVFLTLLAYCFYSMAKSVVSTFFFALATYPICWSPMLINIYKLVLNASVGIFSIIGYILLSNLAKANDPLICAMSHLFLLSSYIWSAFAQHNWQVFTNSVFNTFANYQTPLTWSILATWLKPHEVNIAFIFIIVTNELVTSFGDECFKRLFTKTNYQHRNIILLVAACFSIVPLILNIVLYIVKRRIPELTSTAEGPDEPLLNTEDTSDSSPSIAPIMEHPPLTNDASLVSYRLLTIGNITLNVTIRARAIPPQSQIVQHNESTHDNSTTPIGQNLIHL